MTLNYYWEEIWEKAFVSRQIPYRYLRRAQWPRGLRKGSASARLLGIRVLIPLGACLSVCLSVSCECCVLCR
jgi:hypothetical protein